MLRMTKGQKSQVLLGACCMRLRPGLGRARNGTKGPGLEGPPDAVSPLLGVGFGGLSAARHCSACGAAAVFRPRYSPSRHRLASQLTNRVKFKNTSSSACASLVPSARAAVSHDGPGRALYFYFLYRMCTGPADGQGRPPFSYMIQQYRRHASYRHR